MTEQQAIEIDLSGYSIQFTQTVFGWTYVTTTPEGGTLRPMMGLFVEKRAAQRAALHQIERMVATETLDGNALRDSLH